MAHTQDDIDKLDSAIGVLQSMKLGDQEFVFRPLDELVKLRALMQQEVNAAAGKSRNYRLAATKKGVEGPNGGRFGTGWFGR